MDCDLARQPACFRRFLPVACFRGAGRPCRHRYWSIVPWRSSAMMQHEKDDLLALFENRRKWCQGVEARDRRGSPVCYSDATATAWDMVGGMCCLFGWDRAFSLFLQVGRHFTGAQRCRTRRNREIAAMVSLQDFNDRPDTTYDVIMERLRTMPVYCPRPSLSAESSGNQPSSTSTLCSP